MAEQDLLEQLEKLHAKKTLYTIDDGQSSYLTAEDAREAGDLEPFDEVDTFDICTECGRIEAEARAPGHTWDYLNGLWPCPTATILEAAGQRLLDQVNAERAERRS